MREQLGLDAPPRIKRGVERVEQEAETAPEPPPTQRRQVPRAHHAGGPPRRRER
jgi:hypothetical protein